ncbi:MAG: hypothetical protein M1839_008152 [Geoglossum umbratile]|nr:MAG: hypothetical protein M1839_008152 [Geoglossum umbratile]
MLLDIGHEARAETRLLLNYWLKLLLPVGLSTETEVLEAQSLEGGTEWVNKVVLARLSADNFETAVAEFLGYYAEFGSALLGDFGFDNTVDNGIAGSGAHHFLAE